MRYSKFGRKFASLALVAALALSIALPAEAQTRLPVPLGGTGAGSFTSNRILKGNGTGALQASGVSIDSSNNITGANNLVFGKTERTVGVAGSGADCITDGSGDQAEINSCALAVNAAGGGVLRILKGTFTINDLIQLPSTVAMRCSGVNSTVIKAANSYNPATAVYGSSGLRVMVIGYNSAAISNSEISDCTFDGNVQNIPGLVSNSGHRIIWIENATNFRLSNNKFLNGINWTVYFNLCDRLFIDGNTVLGGYSSTYNQNDGIHTRDSINFSITGNYVDTTAGGGTSGDDAIVVGTRTGSTSDWRMVWYQVTSYQVLAHGASLPT